MEQLTPKQITQQYVPKKVVAWKQPSRRNQLITLSIHSSMWMIAKSKKASKPQQYC